MMALLELYYFLKFMKKHALKSKVKRKIKSRASGQNKNNNTHKANIKSKKKKVTKGIIHTGGKGTRLYPVTLETAKPLLTVCRKPIINYIIELFKEHGINDIKITTKKPDMEDFEWWLKRFEKNLEGVKISFEIEDEPMGTFGCIYHRLRPWIGDDDVVISNGDEIKKLDLSRMVDFHGEQNSLATIMLVKVENPQDYGVAVMDGHIITDFLEKPQNPPSQYISGGLYILSPEAFDHVQEGARENKFLMIEKELFPHLTKTNKLTGFKTEESFFDCGTFERWERAIKHLSK